MQSIKTQAIILRRRNFGEKDRLLTLFSQDLGKIEVLSKGARRPGSKLSYSSDLGTVCNFQISKTRSIDILREAETVFALNFAHGDLKKTERISYVLKFVDKVFDLEQPHPRSYSALKNALQNLDSADHQMSVLVFLISALAELGVLPELYQCGLCSEKITPKELSFSHSSGLVHDACANDDCSKVSEREIKLLRVIASSPIDQVMRAKVAPAIFNKTYNLIKHYARWHYGDILPDKVL